MVKIDYVDNRGVNRRVLLKASHEKPEKGIPVDVYNTLDEIYIDAPEHLRVSLYNRLWALGLIEPHDFTRPDATTRMRQALVATFARDATNTIRYVLEQSQ